MALYCVVTFAAYSIFTHIVHCTASFSTGTAKYIASCKLLLNLANPFTVVLTVQCSLILLDINRIRYTNTLSITLLFSTRMSSV